MIAQEVVGLSLGALLAILTLLIIFAGLIVTGMRMYASVTQDMAALKAKVERLEKIHNGGHDQKRR